MPDLALRCPACGVVVGKAQLDPISVSMPAVAPTSGFDRRLSRLPTQPDLTAGGGGTAPSRRLGGDGDTAADYRLMGTVGEGGMGIVWDAVQTGVERHVALKRLRPGREMLGAQLLAEARLTGELEHPGIVPVHEVGIDQDGVPFYAMRRVRGPTWMERWRQLTLAEHLGILLRVADAIAYAHSRGILHRDIKPANVVLGEYGEVVVVDWGLATRVEDLRRRGDRTASGTPAYMAPEMARAQLERIGPRSDVYLLGATLYEILVGEPPHPGIEPVDLLMAAAENRIQPTIPEGELGDICRRALAAEPDDRHADVRAFQSDLRRHLDHAQSLELAARARQRLVRGQRDGAYDDFVRAVHGYQDALELWEGNAAARAGLAEARHALGERAMQAGDLDLAASVLEPSDVSGRARLAAAQARRRSRQRWLRTLIAATAVLVVLVALVATAGYLAVSRQRDLVVRIARERDDAEALLAAEAEARSDRRFWRRVVQEDFRMARLPPRWRSLVGAWTVGDGHLRVADGGPALVELPLSVHADVLVQLDVQQGGSCSLTLGDGNGIAVRLAEGIEVAVGGRTLAQAAFPETAPGLPRRLRIDLVRGDLRVLVDGATVLLWHRIEDLAPPLPVRLGGLPGVAIDNLKVEVPDETA